jgi:hypothetical protein
LISRNYQAFDFADTKFSMNEVLDFSQLNSIARSLAKYLGIFKADWVAVAKSSPNTPPLITPV